MTNHHDAKAFDCGDGVPDLRLLASEEDPTPRTDDPPISALTAAMGLTIIGQLAILLAVLAGGNAVVGAMAGLGLLACGLTMVGVRSLRSIGTVSDSEDQAPVEKAGLA